MDKLTKRNFHALSEGLKEQRSVNNNQNALLKTLQNTIAQMQQQIQTLQSQNAIYMANSYGNGATQR